MPVQVLALGQVLALVLGLVLVLGQALRQALVLVLALGRRRDGHRTRYWW